MQISSLLPEEKRGPLADTIGIFHKGFDPVKSVVQTTVLGGVAVPENIGNLLSSFSDSTLVFKPPKSFMLCLESPLGWPVEIELKKSLLQITRLASLVRVLQKQKLSPTKLTLGSISFEYYTPPQTDPENPPLSCTIILPNTPGARNTLELGPPEWNPHYRVKSHLEGILQADPSLFFKMLSETLPVMRSLRDIESKGAATVRTRAVDNFRLVYSDALTTFDLALKKRRQVPHWVLSENAAPGSTMNPLERTRFLARRPAGYQTAMKIFFTESNDKVRGLENGLACPADSGMIEQKVIALDSKLRELMEASRASQRQNGDLEKATAPPTQAHNGLVPGQQPRSMPNTFQRNQRGGSHMTGRKPSTDFIVLD
jgi:hypothetical protein